MEDNNVKTNKLPKGDYTKCSVCKQFEKEWR